jgi:hypothetical protein
MNPIDLTTTLAITLQVQEWNQILALLHEVLAPNRITTPLIQKISEQAQAAIAQSTTPLMNGADSHVPN